MKYGDIRDIQDLYCDDITFCQEQCDWLSCPRNQKNIRDKTIPHSFFVEIPEDCPKNGKAVERIPDRESVIGHLNDCMEASRRDNTWVFVRKNIVEDAIAMLEEKEPVEPTIKEDGEAYCICGENVGIIPNSKNLPSIRLNYCPKCGRRMKWKYD